MLISSLRFRKSAAKITLLACMTFTGGSAFAQDDDKPANSQTIKPVKLTTIQSPASTMERSFFGKVTARETVNLSFDVGGKLVFSPLAEGARVKAGEVIGRLEQDNFERAVGRAELSVAQAERTLKRAQDLADRRVGPRSAADDALTVFELAQVSLNDAREALADTVLEAPFDGLLASRLVPTFSTVAPGQPILRLHDMSELRVEISVPENLATSISDLSIVRFEATLPDGSKTGPLALREYSPETGQVGQTYTVTLALPSDLPPSILPGASLSVAAKIAVNSTLSPSVPASALVIKPDRSAFVMVYQPGDDGSGGNVAEASVKVVSSNGAEIQIEGVEPNTQIVATGAHLLEDGQPVRPFLGFSVSE